MNRQNLIRFTRASLVIVLLTTIGVAQQQSAPPETESKHHFKITSDFDYRSNITRISTQYMPLGDGLGLSARAIFRGEKPTGAPSVILFDFADSQPKVENGSSRHGKYEEIELLMDSSSLQLRATQYEQRVGKSPVVEIARTELTQAKLKLILDTQKVKGRWGKIEFELSPEILEALRNFADSIQRQSTSEQKESSKWSPQMSIKGGVLQGHVLNKVEPIYPDIAKAARASGRVQVQIVIDEKGKVISAEAISGHPLLRKPAIDAAYQWLFSPTELEGKPVKVQGILTFDFSLRL